MTRERFDQLVEEALRTIPRRFREAMRNIAVVVEDEPSPALLREVGIRPPGTLFGLYQGVPLTYRGWTYGNTMPDRIIIFQRPIEEECKTDEEARAAIAETVIHEIGHYFGMSETQIRSIERQYWRRRQ